ncbi:hypothetical protein HRG_005941 [Hirsutella rhossiliensis]|uniref:Hirsutellin A toxin n=1 Tax=Hirsutella rhossiliensis TaxID=111463 RepID=A0A9P8N025_9HYPO|nr:uncharacterized protein HRG_05941 [Hirsutella rhossiliensis]KAH0963431.1 hypothetical protein HRG_05941 [Hirsutella rhossiliensis]
MKLSAALLATGVLSAASAFAAPGLDVKTAHLESRAPVITCNPKLQGDKAKKPYQVDEATARAQAKVAGPFSIDKAPKSGFPHRFHNGEKIHFNIADCDKEEATLWEYPIYWVDKKVGKKAAVWNIQTKKKDQPGGPTPIRVVYSGEPGHIHYCGVMVHSEVNKDGEATAKTFDKCP